MKVVLSLGSNVKDRRGAIVKAISLLREKILVKKVSSLYETEPWGYKKQEKFLNVVISGETNLKPESLLSFVKDVERRVGRRERFRWGPREIDVDIVLYEDLVFENEYLKIPHRYYRKRDFVLIPLLEIEGDFVDPEEGKRVREIFGKKKGNGVRKVEDFSFKRDVFSEFNLSIIDVPYNIFLFSKIPSTQRFLKENFGHNLLAVSSIQTEGRGRKGNYWLSKKGGLWFSFTEKPFKSIYTLPLLSALSVARVIKNINVKGVNIKIPNDVYIKDRKVSGIISEGIFSDVLLGEVVGVGLNVNLNESDLEGNFIKPPTSIFIEKKEFEFLDILLNRIVFQYKRVTKDFLVGRRKRLIEELIYEFSLFDKPFRIVKDGRITEVYGLDMDEDFNIKVKYREGLTEIIPLHMVP